MPVKDRVPFCGEERRLTVILSPSESKAGRVSIRETDCTVSSDRFSQSGAEFVASHFTRFTVTVSFCNVTVKKSVSLSLGSYLRRGASIREKEKPSPISCPSKVSLPDGKAETEIAPEAPPESPNPKRKSSGEKLLPDSVKLKVPPVLLVRVCGDLVSISAAATAKTKTHIKNIRIFFENLFGLMVMPPLLNGFDFDILYIIKDNPLLYFNDV